METPTYPPVNQIVEKSREEIFKVITLEEYTNFFIASYSLLQLRGGLISLFPDEFKQMTSSDGGNIYKKASDAIFWTHLVKVASHDAKINYVEAPSDGLAPIFNEEDLAEDATEEEHEEHEQCSSVDDTTPPDSGMADIDGFQQFPAAASLPVPLAPAPSPVDNSLPFDPLEPISDLDPDRKVYAQFLLASLRPEYVEFRFL